jgi:hypothetical protein
LRIQHWSDPVEKNPINVQFPIPNSYPKKPLMPWAAVPSDENSELRNQHWSDPVEKNPTNVQFQIPNSYPKKTLMPVGCGSLG